MTKPARTTALLILTTIICHLDASRLRAADPVPVEKQWTIDGVTRKALLFAPETAAKADVPLIFAFHGHGGTMQSASRTFAFQKLWPEALVVYMQGLPTIGKTDPDGKLPGWQRLVGDQQDRDLKFFDQVLADLKKEYKVDQRRIYVTGHSNGGLFTYLLWGARGDVLAAVAPSAGVAIGGLNNFKPKPALHVAGEQDQLVPIELQKRMMEAVRKLNGCDPQGNPWAKSGGLVGTIYPSKTATPFVSIIYPGTHKFPSEAPELIVKFFKENEKPKQTSAAKG
jgi:polyhydroxybutyrate depolymerase